MASTVATGSDRAKKCKFYKNGDKTFTGKYVVLNKRRIRTWDSLLEEVTRGTRSDLPVRAICTPLGGTTISDLEQLEENGNYVALARGRFRNLG